MDKREGFRWLSGGKTFQTEISASSEALVRLCLTCSRGKLESQCDWHKLKKRASEGREQRSSQDQVTCMILSSKARTLVLTLSGMGSHWMVLSRGVTWFAWCCKWMFFYKFGFYGTSSQLTQSESAAKESAIPPIPHWFCFVAQLQNEPQTITKYHGHLLCGSQWKWQPCVISSGHPIQTARRKKRLHSFNPGISSVGKTTHTEVSQ